VSNVCLLTFRCEISFTETVKNGSPATLPLAGAELRALRTDHSSKARVVLCRFRQSPITCECWQAWRVKGSVAPAGQLLVVKVGPRCGPPDLDRCDAVHRATEAEGAGWSGQAAQRRHYNGKLRLPGPLWQAAGATTWHAGTLFRLPATYRHS
jgi:hypothetical protein